MSDCHDAAPLPGGLQLSLAGIQPVKVDLNSSNPSTLTQLWRQSGDCRQGPVDRNV
jgi:hypothetical protein